MFRTLVSHGVIISPMILIKILALLNLLLGFLFTILASFTLFGGLSLYTALASIAAFIYILLFYISLKKKTETIQLLIYVFLMLQPIAWLLITLISFFTTGVISIAFPVTTFVFAIITFSILKKRIGKFSYVISFLTLIVFIFSIIYRFEEQYCWNKGDQVDRIIKATKEDAVKLKEFDVKEGQEIGAGFRAHMLCHDTFNLYSALKEKYLFIK